MPMELVGGPHDGQLLEVDMPDNVHQVIRPTHDDGPPAMYRRSDTQILDDTTGEWRTQWHYQPPHAA